MPRTDPESDVLRAFAEAVDDYRESSRLSYEGLAERFGRAPSFMWKICAQRRLTADQFPDLLGRLAACTCQEEKARAALIGRWLKRFEAEMAERAAAAAALSTPEAEPPAPARTPSLFAEEAFGGAAFGGAKPADGASPRPPASRPALRLVSGSERAPARPTPSHAKGAAEAPRVRGAAPPRGEDPSAETKHPAEAKHSDEAKPFGAAPLQPRDGAGGVENFDIARDGGSSDPAAPDAPLPAERAGRAALDPFELEGFDRLGRLLRPELARAQNHLDAVSILYRHRSGGDVACEFFSGDLCAPESRRLGLAAGAFDLDDFADRIAPFALDIEAAEVGVEPPVAAVGPRHRVLLLARRGGDARSEIAHLFGFHNFQGDDLRRTRMAAFRLISRASEALAIDFGEIDPEE